MRRHFGIFCASGAVMGLSSKWWPAHDHNVDINTLIHCAHHSTTCNTAITHIAARQWHDADQHRLLQECSPSVVCRLADRGLHLANQQLAPMLIDGSRHDPTECELATQCILYLNELDQREQHPQHVKNVIQRALAPLRTIRADDEQDVMYDWLCDANDNESLMLQFTHRPDGRRLWLCLRALSLLLRDSATCATSPEIVYFVTQVYNHYCKQCKSNTTNQTNTTNALSAQLCLLSLNILANYSAASANQHLALHNLYSAGSLKIAAEILLNEKSSLPSKLLARRLVFNLCSQQKGSPKLREGLYLLSDTQPTKRTKQECDVVFVHGLNGGLFRTWRQSDQQKGTDTYTQCWPKDWLVSSLQSAGLTNHNIRLFGCDYDTWLSAGPSTNKGTVLSDCQLFINKFETAALGKRRIIWVCHSMGGLIVKQMLLNNAALASATKAVIFLSTPHLGSETATNYTQSRASYVLKPSPDIVQLALNHPRLVALNSAFIELANQRSYTVLSISEALPLTLSWRSHKWQWSHQVVSERSAWAGTGALYSLPLTHMNTSKPSSQSDPLYVLICEAIQQACK